MGHKVSDTYIGGSGNWLKAKDLAMPNGGYARVTARISAVEMATVPKERGSAEIEHRLEVHFEGRDKCLLCNRTNAKTIASMYGDDTDGWLGRDIEMTVTQTNMGPGVLVLPGIPGPQAQPQPQVQPQAHTAAPQGNVTNVTLPDDEDDGIPW